MSEVSKQPRAPATITRVMNVMRQTVEIRRLEDLDRVAQDVGLPVGSRIGRSQDEKEWYVLIGF